MTEFEDVARQDGPGDPMPPSRARLGARTGLHDGCDRRPRHDPPRLLWGLAALIAAGLVLATCAAPAHAEPVPCPTLAATLASYKAQFGETPHTLGRLLSDEGFLLIVASPAGEWTMFIVSEAGHACPLAHGDTLHRVPEGVPS